MVVTSEQNEFIIKIENVIAKVYRYLLINTVFLLSLLAVFSVSAAVLDADRADVLYHSYDGGGMKIDGPAILLRKKASESVAFSAYYYVDMISSASVDVMSTASPYSEERIEGQLGIEYLLDKSVIAFTLRQSDESDYLSKSFNLNISHDTFGDLTNLNLGLAFGDNEIGRNGDENFEEHSQQFRIRAGINQIITRNLTLGLTFEAVADEGYLNNPYRTVRYIDNSVPSGVGYQSEVYPQTRNSFASKLSLSYYLPYRAALFVNARHFSDSWEIDSNDVEFGYRHPLGNTLELEFKVRFYQQTQASFYSDLFPYQDAQNYLARDKELSAFSDITLGMGITYVLPKKYSIADWDSEVSFQWDHIAFDYDNFRDPTAEGGIGAEPFYGFSANVIRVFFSLYF
ncbi:MAG: DUF3570 domain-containing protein [Colwellia sp.]|nr:DUF3570 domain-containing protein [Colwellia sp.]